MAKRQLLSRVISVMLTLLLFGFIYILFAGLGTNANKEQQTTDKKNQTPFDLEPGQTEIRRHQGQRIWVTKLSTQQVTQLANVDDWVLDPNSGCQAQQTWCLIESKTQQTGIEIRFTNKRPPQLNNTTPWAGGFVNPSNGAVYDLLGRSYKSNSAQTKPAINLYIKNTFKQTN